MRILLTGLLAAALSPGAWGVIRVPVTSAPRLPGWRQRLLRGALRVAAASGSGGQTSWDVVLQNIGNARFYGEIYVGTPAQPVNVVFNTGSSDFWVPSIRSRSHSSQRLRPHESSSYEATAVNFHSTYGSWPVSGMFCRDRIDIGGIVLDNFTFAEVDDTCPAEPHDEIACSGMLGLGFPSGSVGEVPAIMQALVQSGQLEEPAFGFYLPRDQAGQLVLGGVDPTHYVGDFTFLNVTEPGLWAVSLDGVSTGSDHLARQATNMAIVDPGTWLLLGPSSEVAALAVIMGARCLGGLCAVDCYADLPNLTFTLGGQDFVLEKDDLVVAADGSTCWLGLRGLDSEATAWVLGTVFMRKYYVHFDWGGRRLGFARAAAGRRPADPA